MTLPRDGDVMIARATLQKMFRGDFFNICAVTDACKVLGIPFYGGTIYERLHALHCVHWSTMTPELREHVVELVSSVVGQAPFDPIPDSIAAPPIIDVRALAAPVEKPGLVGKAMRLFRRP